MRVVRQVAVIVLAAAALATTGARQSDPPREEVITNPSWAVQPSPEFPTEALEAGISEGTASLHCIVEPSGAATNCQILSEAPPGYGFGDAAIAAASTARFNPRLVDGVATRATVTFATNFAMSAEPYAMVGCMVASSGALDGCQILNEHPSDQGLGSAALGLLSRHRIAEPAAWMLENGVGIAVMFEGSTPILPPGLEIREGDEIVITNPSWQERPQPIYPSSAHLAGITSGSATLRCHVERDGRVVGCEVVEETPPGHGFGDAALAAGLAARLNPRTFEGEATRSTVMFTVRFTLTG